MLPITRVALFKHGVGYFQRTGTVEGNDVIELSFKAAQMNDVLKSLTTLDHDGGSFAALSYESEEPLERRKADLNLEIPDKGALTSFLDRLKGAAVRVPRSGKDLSGSIVGIQEVRRTVGNEVVSEPQLVVLQDGRGLVRIPVLEIKKVELLDETVRRDLQSLLDILVSSLRKDRKRLSIQAVGEGKRSVSISYVVEAPVWKASYRILLDSDSAEKPLLQGWALVDNTTEDDWTQVSLSLVAGLPISFIHDLYKPRYQKRPILKVQEEAAVAPPDVESALEQKLVGRRESVLAKALGGEEEEYEEDEEKHELPVDAMMWDTKAAPRRFAARKSVPVHTVTQEMGDLFAYEITHPVDIQRGCSALVPVLQKDADAERVLLYNPGIRRRNPLTALRLVNETGLTLEGGPVTVFEDDSYVGESMLKMLRHGEKSLVPYSVELGVTVQPEEEKKREDFTRVTRSGQYVVKHYRELRLVSYRIHSRLDKDKTLFLDHRFSSPIREDTPEPEEVTESFWRFKLELPPAETTTFRVTEVTKRRQVQDVRNLVRNEIHELAARALIPREALGQLERIASQKETLARLEKTTEEIKEQVSEIQSGQQRLRENLKALGKSSEEITLRRTYISKLTAQEEQIESLQKDQEKMKARISSEKEKLDEMVEKLSLEEAPPDISQD